MRINLGKFFKTNKIENKGRTLDWHWKNSKGLKLTNPNLPMCFRGGSDKQEEHDWYLYLNYKFPIATKTPIHRNTETGEFFIGFTDDLGELYLVEEHTYVRYEGFLVSNTFNNGHTCPIPEFFVEDSGWILYEEK